MIRANKNFFDSKNSILLLSLSEGEQFLKSNNSTIWMCYAVCLEHELLSNHDHDPNASNYNLELCFP